MDDLKRSIYMEARRMIDEGEQDFVCVALIAATIEMIGVECDMPISHWLSELFPEFFELYDGTYWSLERVNGKRVFYSGDIFSHHSAWWLLDWVEPRLAALDFILNNNRQGVKRHVGLEM